MGKSTPFLGLYKPGGGSLGTNTPDEVMDIDRLNQDFDVIDLNAKNTDTRLDIVEAKTLFYVPTGALIMWGDNGHYPPGWFLCNGQAVSRTTYAALFTILGTQYGTGDGTTTFNLPNFKGRFPVGIDAAQTEFDTIGETGGAKTVALTEAHIPSTSGNRTIDATQFEVGGGNAPLVAGSGNRHKYNVRDTATAHQNLPPYLTIEFLIKN